MGDSWANFGAVALIALIVMNGCWGFFVTLRAMRTLLWVILAMAVLATAGGTGCRRAARYDARLVAADNLMRDFPDSALAVVEAVSPGSLGGEGDRAYRSLLLTQARYRCYVTATGDSAINSALAYYRRHGGEREKLTRAYIYKGAVMEELGHPDSAMLYYKHAEATADKKDYVNLGQINTRIASLYRVFYADKQTCYDKYAQALKYYRLTGNKRLQLNCLYNMGGCSGITRIGEPRALLEQATQLAVELNDSLEYFMCQEMLCRQLYYQKETLEEAKQIALHCLNSYQSYVNNDLLLDLADIYIRCGMPDSARFFLNFIDLQSTSSHISQIKTRKHLIISRVARFEGDTALSNHHDMLAHQVSDSVGNSNNKYLIQKIEHEFNRRQYSDTLSSITSLHWTIIAIVSFAMLIAALFTALHFRRKRDTRAIIDGLVNSSLDRHERLLIQLENKNGVIERQLANLVELMKQCASNPNMRDTGSNEARHIKQAIIDAANDDFWPGLLSYLDKTYGGLVSDLSHTPGITEKDLRFISLCCCGFSNSEIALILGYSLKYVSNKRKNITRKLGIDTHLQEHLNELMAEKQGKSDY